MSFIHRGFLYVTRKRTKTLILFLLLLVIATLVLSGIAIKNATQTAQLNVRQSLGGIFTLNQNTNDSSKWQHKDVGGYGQQSYYGGAPLTTELADYIQENVDGIQGYNATYTNYSVPKNSAGKTLELIKNKDGATTMDGIMGGSGDFNKTVATYASTNTLYDSYFAGGYVELTKGRHLKPEDKNVAVISQEFAEKNNLDVGDTITLQMSQDKAAMLGMDAAGAKQEVEIIGLFKPTAKSTTTLSNWSMDNSIYTTMEVLKTVRPDMGDESYEHIHFYANDPGQLEKIVADIKALPEIDPTDFVVDVDTSNMDAVMKPLSNMNRLIVILIVLIVVVGAVVLYLVLANRVKERIHESGILLSLGIGKTKIIMQYLTEILLVAILAIGISFFTSSAVAQSVGNQLLDYAMQDVQTDAKKDPISNNDGNIIADPDALAPQFEQKNQLTKINVSIDGKAVALLGGVGFALICCSVILATLPVLQLKPKEILTKMS